MVIREEMEKSVFMVKALGARLRQARDRLDRHARTPRSDSPRVDAIYRTAALGAKRVPGELRLSSGDVTTLRAELGKALGYFNAASGGALLCASADLLGSTSLSAAVKGFPEGYYNARKNPRARVLPVGGICEDAMSAILSGISTFGRAIGVGSSYAGFLAPLGHVASRLHAIGSQAKGEKGAGPYNPVILVCAHAGLKTGEDGPTHADPQALQLLQENFPLGTCVTLTPLEPREVWFLLAAALARRPAIIAPFVTRPNETVIDRDALGLAPAAASPMGVYRLRAAKGRKPDGFVVLQGSEVGYAFLQDALPLIEKHGIDLEVYYVSSAELFDLLPPAMKRRTYPHAAFENAFGITGFTLPTMFKWIGSTHGREHSLHPFKKGRYLGSGSGRMVMEEAGLDGNNQFRAMRKFLDGMTRARGR
jgi:transketolase